MRVLFVAFEIVMWPPVKSAFESLLQKEVCTAMSLIEKPFSRSAGFAVISCWMYWSQRMFSYSKVLYFRAGADAD